MATEEKKNIKTKKEDLKTDEKKDEQSKLKSKKKIY